MFWNERAKRQAFKIFSELSNRCIVLPLLVMILLAAVTFFRDSKVTLNDSISPKTKDRVTMFWELDAGLERWCVLEVPDVEIRPVPLINRVLQFLPMAVCTTLRRSVVTNFTLGWSCFWSFCLDMCCDGVKISSISTACLAYVFYFKRKKWEDVKRLYMGSQWLREARK